MPLTALVDRIGLPVAPRVVWFRGLRIETRRATIMSRMAGRMILMGVGLALWGGLLWGSLTLTQGAGSQAHSICGVWGCGPPTQVLAGCHAFWFVLLGLPAVVGMNLLSAGCLRHLGWGLFWTSVLLVIAVCGLDLWNWWPTASEVQRGYVLRRIGFAAVTNVEVPGLAILVWSLVLVRAGGMKRGAGEGCELLRERRSVPCPAE